MYFTFIILAIIVCVFLGLIILIQNPKGGGLSSGFSGSNNIMGVQRTGDFLEKGTWGLTIALMVLAILINITVPRNGEGGRNSQELQKQINKPQVNPLAQPSAPLPGTSDSSKK